MNNKSPITRVVKLTLRPECIEEFKAVFASHQQMIGKFEGCEALAAFQDSSESAIFFTISQWQSEHHLDAYRYSDFFKLLWQKVKPMFAAKAEAHSLNPV
jgi:quinol monooxygenase YgiN